MQYKALMLDIDGTVIPYDYDSHPSEKVRDAIKAAVDKGINVCLVTGRSYPSTKYILEFLGLSTGYAVVDGGAFVYNLSEKKPLYERYIRKVDMDEIIRIFKEENVQFYIKDEISLTGTKDPYFLYDNSRPLKNVSMIFTEELFSLERTHEIMKRLSLPTINIFRTRHKDLTKYAFNITHAGATKLHGVQIICKNLDIKKSEIIGVGDGYNDFPLLMASGLKVAMGNAIEDLKNIADYIAPTVDNDGVADVIEKFILNPTT